MRKAQRKYMKSQNRKDLIAMKRLEIKVDKILKTGFKYKQGELFT